MAKEICISSTPHETRLAILEDDQLAEIYYERENEYTLAGSIYKGRVTRVLPGMQSAFVDLGLERDAFLYVTDFLEEQEEDSDEFERVDAGGNGRKQREPREAREPREQRESREGREQREPRESRPRPEEQETELQASEAQPRRGDQEHRDEGESGTRRWHGRRGRRFRGRGPRGERSLESPEIVEEAISAEPVALPERGAPGGVPAQNLPIVLPGESLSKYGGGAEGRPARSESSNARGESPNGGSTRPQPSPSTTTSKPSTLVEIPTGWDGGFVLPGESLSRHRRRDAEPSSAEAAFVESSPQSSAFAEAPLASAAPAEIEAPSAEPAMAASAPTLLEPAEQTIPETIPEPLTGPASLEARHEEPSVAESPSAESAVAPQPAAPESLEPGIAALTPAPHTPPPESLAETVEEVHEYEPEDASASHRVDPIRSEFRFSTPIEEAEEFQAEEAFAPEAIPAPETAEHPADTPSASTEAPATSPEAEVVRQLFGYTPGMGILEEETIDEDEYEFEPIPGQPDEHGIEEMEEETLDHASTMGDAVRDVHIDKRLGYDNPAEAAEQEESEDRETPGTIQIEEEGFEDASFDEAVEEDFEEAGEDEEQGEQPAQQAGAPARREDRRFGRRGGRGRQGGGGRRGHGRRPNMQTMDLPIISELLKQGQEILVQIAKEPIARKGARITSHIALPGRFLVFMPTVNHVGVSRKIASDEERQRLKRILISEKGNAPGGFIVRTAAESAGEEDLRADIRFLINLWAEIKQRSDAAKAPALIYHDLNLVERILRDQVSDSFSTIWVDSESEYERIVRFLNRFQPSLVRRVKLYTKEMPLFEQFGIQEEISKALKSKVWLKSGGSIVINQTEALVAIDINTGKYVGKTARLEDTILKTNLDAIPEIVRQIRLRDLGGIIVIDFIDMDERRNRQKVTQALEDALKADRAPSKVLQFNDFGLVAITRKRVKQSLERTLSVPCPVCTGTGMVKSPVTVANEIYIEMRKMMRHLERNDVLLRVHPDVVKVLKANNAKWLNELEEMTSKTIIVKSDPALPPEQFDIQG